MLCVPLSKDTDTPTQAPWRGALQRAHTGTNTVPQHTATSAPLTRVVPWGIGKQAWQTLLSNKTRHPRCCHAGAVVHIGTRRGTGTNTVPQHTATSAPLIRVMPWGIDKQTWQTLLSIKTKHPRCCHAGAVVRPGTRRGTGTNTVPQHTATSAPLTRVLPRGIDKQTWQTLLSIKTKHPRCCHAGAVVHARTRRGTRSKGLLGLGHAEVLILADDHAEVLIGRGFCSG